MVFTINLTTLIAICTALGFAGAAALWAFRLYDKLRRLPGLIITVQGDPESDDPEVRDGVVGRLSDIETTTGQHGVFFRALCRALRIHPSSDEYAFAEAIRVSIIEGRISENTGPHPAVIVAQPLPVPVHIPRKPTPYRGEIIPREDPPTDPDPIPPPRKR